MTRKPSKPKAFTFVQERDNGILDPTLLLQPDPRRGGRWTLAVARAAKLRALVSNHKPGAGTITIHQGGMVLTIEWPAESWEPSPHEPDGFALKLEPINTCAPARS